MFKDGKQVDAVTLVGRPFHARATVTRNHRSSMVLSRVQGTIRRGQEPDRSQCRDSEINAVSFFLQKHCWVQVIKLCLHPFSNLVSTIIN